MANNTKQLNQIELLPGVRIIDLVLQIGTTIVVGDVHIGIEEALNKQGIMIPRFHFGEIMGRMERILEQARPEKVILIGDVKHEFGMISEQEWRETLQFLDLLLAHAKEVVLIRGNHDTILGPIARKRNLTVQDQAILGDILLLHGDKIPSLLPPGIATIIIGHEHPAVTIRDKIRAETYKCFLKGTYKKKKLIVLPSFHPMSEGTNILQEELLSPFLHQDLSSFEVYIAGDTTYYFGKVKNLLC
ncbi:metallophosphoesterase [Candidatus Woesearchaeota archaeon]|nr:metallophosphoesterase [Candidatus Woesearchaeota archaeon]